MNLPTKKDHIQIDTPQSSTITSKRVNHATLGYHLLGISLNKNIIYQSWGMGLRKVSKEYEDESKNSKIET